MVLGATRANHTQPALLLAHTALVPVRRR